MDIHVLAGPLHNDPEGHICPIEGCAKGLFRVILYRALGPDRIAPVGGFLICELHPDLTRTLAGQELGWYTPRDELPEGPR